MLKIAVTATTGDIKLKTLEIGTAKCTPVDGKYGDDCDIRGPDDEDTNVADLLPFDVANTLDKDWFGTPDKSWSVDVDALKFQVTKATSTHLTSRWIKRTDDKQQLTFEISAPAGTTIELFYIKRGSKDLVKAKNDLQLTVGRYM